MKCMYVCVCMRICVCACESMCRRAYKRGGGGGKEGEMVCISVRCIEQHWREYLAMLQTEASLRLCN